MITPSAPLQVVCPVCRGALDFQPSAITCRNCRSEFFYTGGFPDLIVGGGFEDEDDPERSAYEEACNEYTARHYLLPVFQTLFHGSPFSAHEPPRLLSLGCGCGTDVDVLSAAGFEVTGVDCGNRSAVWPRRERKHRLFLANGKHLPFEDATFDLVYCGCVFPHVGVKGDSNHVLPDYFQQRLAVAKEMARVLKPDGFILTSSPNRWFPLDLFHGRTTENPYPRWNPPTSPFLLSPADYRRLFRSAGCNLFQLLPVSGYWGFIRMKQSWKGRLLAFPVESVFRAVSTASLAFLRGSPISPWLVMLMKKSTIW